MINFTTIGNKVKGVLVNFSKNVTDGLKKTSQKFIADMLFGISASQSCILTEIARGLKEDISVKKTEERLARNLKEFTDNERDIVMDNYLKTVKSSVNDETMIIVDPSDVTKPCSPHMESIGTVKDGSTGEFAPGYWTVGAVILSPNTSQPIPIYENIYPCKKQGGDGLNAEVLKCLQSLRSNGFSPDIPRVYDRGGDSGLIFEDLHNNSEKFIIRQNHNRTVICNGKRRKISEVARGIECDYEMKFTGKNGKTETCQIGITTVTIPYFTNTKMKNFKVNLVVCKGWGDEPLILYTNLDESIEKIALRVVKAYLKRWRIEELYGFKKQTLDFEGFRVRSFKAIKNLDIIVTILIGYIALQAEKDDSITDSLIVASRRIEPIRKFMRETKFFLYAISDGITAVLAQLKCGISHFFERKPVDLQLSLPWV